MRLATACLLVGAGLLAAAPLAFNATGGDSSLYRNYYECFASALWAGDVYPRWCFEANNGAGAPIFLFYFPLGYWFAAPLYPLLAKGVSFYAFYKALLCAACIAGAFSSYYWLRRWLTPAAAVFGAAVYVTSPYFTQLLLNRAAYAELWAMALLPLLFAQSWDARNKNGFSPTACALVFAALILTHVPAATVAATFSCLYVLPSRTTQAKPFILWMLGLFVGMLCTAFYLFPAIYYTKFLAVDSMPQVTLFDRAFTWTDLTSPRALQVSIPILTGFLLICVSTAMTRRCSFHRDAVRWGALAAIGMAMAFGGAWLLHLFPGLRRIFFPWRMLAVTSLALAATASMRIQLPLATPKGRADAALLLLFLLLLAQMNLFSHAPGQEAVLERREQLRLANFLEYTSRWKTTESDTPEFYAALSGQPLCAFTAGAGTIFRCERKRNEIDLQIQAAGAARLRIRQHYFPSFVMEAPAGDAAQLEPDAATGFMQISLPPGEHTITLRHAPAHAGTPWPVRLSGAISVLALLSLTALRRRFIFPLQAANSPL